MRGVKNAGVVWDTAVSGEGERRRKGQERVGRRKLAEEPGERKDFKKQVLETVKLLVTHLKKKTKKEAKRGRARISACQISEMKEKGDNCTGNQERQPDGCQLVERHIRERREPQLQNSESPKEVVAVVGKGMDPSHKTRRQPGSTCGDTIIHDLCAIRLCGGGREGKTCCRQKEDSRLIRRKGRFQHCPAGECETARDTLERSTRTR